jgi:hypothetical protein
MPGTSLTAYAVNFNFNDCVSDVQLYSSGYLKSMKIKIVSGLGNPMSDYENLADGEHKTADRLCKKQELYRLRLDK